MGTVDSHSFRAGRNGHASPARCSMPVCAPPVDYKLSYAGSVGLPRIPLHIAGPKGETLGVGEVRHAIVVT